MKGGFTTRIVDGRPRTSTSTSSPSTMSGRKTPARCRRAGSVRTSRLSLHRPPHRQPTSPPCAARGMPRSSDSRPRKTRVGPAARSASSASRPQNAGFFQPTAQPTRAWFGVMSRDRSCPCNGYPISVRNVSRAPRPQARTPRGAPAKTAGPTRRRPHHWDHQFVSAFAGVAGSTDRDVRADASTRRPAFVDERHVGMLGRQTNRGEEFGRARALHGEDREIAVQVAYLNAVGRGSLKPAHDLRCVSGIRDEEDVVIAPQVDDQVVDDAARSIVGAQRVLRAAGPMRVLRTRDPRKVVGQRGVNECRGARPPNRCLAEMRDVEDSDVLADRGVLGDELRRRRTRAASSSRRTRPSLRRARRGGRAAASG